MHSVQRVFWKLTPPLICFVNVSKYIFMLQVRVNKRENRNDATDIFGLMLTLFNRVLDALPPEYLVQISSEIRIRIFPHAWGNFQIYGVQITENAFVNQILTPFTCCQKSHSFLPSHSRQWEITHPRYDFSENLSPPAGRGWYGQHRLFLVFIWARPFTNNCLLPFALSWWLAATTKQQFFLLFSLGNIFKIFKLLINLSISLDDCSTSWTANKKQMFNKRHWFYCLVMT